MEGYCNSCSNLSKCKKPGVRHSKGHGKNVQNEGILARHTILTGITAPLPQRCPLLQSALSPAQENPCKAPPSKIWLEVGIQGHLLPTSPFMGSAAKSDLLYPPHSETFLFQDTLTCPWFLSRPTPLDCNGPHHPSPPPILTYPSWMLPSWDFE